MLEDERDEPTEETVGVDEEDDPATEDWVAIGEEGMVARLGFVFGRRMLLDGGDRYAEEAVGSFSTLPVVRFIGWAGKLR